MKNNMKKVLCVAAFLLLKSQSLNPNLIEGIA